MGMTPVKEPTFAIGTQFKDVSKRHGKVWTICDILTTRNNEGECVRVEYLAVAQGAFNAMENRFLPVSVARGVHALAQES